jgi:hypothetical protein
MRQEVSVEGGKLHKEERLELLSSSNNFKVIKSRKVRWEGYVARMGLKRITYRVWYKNLKE